MDILVSDIEWEISILQNLREGWNFRVKTVKGHRYITKRKGQKEYSLGKYTPERGYLLEKWKEKEPRPYEIDAIIETLRTRLEISTAQTEEAYKTAGRGVAQEMMRRLEEELVLDRTVTMMMSCKHRDSAGYCVFWRWENPPKFLDIEAELYGEHNFTKKDLASGGKTEEKFIHKATGGFCRGCSAYQKRVFLFDGTDITRIL